MTQTSTEQERAEFEAWANGRCELYLVNPAGRYSSAITQFAWEAWQAARAKATPEVTPQMIEAALEAYMPFGDMELALEAALRVSDHFRGAAKMMIPATQGLDAAQLEAIAQGWDGCMYEIPGEHIDIGAAIREAVRTAQAKQGGAAS